VLGCLDLDPGRRPAAAVLARQLRDVGRFLQLGVAPWPPIADPPDDWSDQPVASEMDRRRPLVALVAALPVTPPQWEGWWR